MAVIVMLKIAIVDDEKLVCSEIMGMLKKYEIEKSFSFSVYSYLSGENLIYEIDDGNSFDLIFLDIELESINGVQVGEYIRNRYNDQKCQIVYVSSKTKYALELFKIRPFDFTEDEGDNVRHATIISKIDDFEIYYAGHTSSTNKRNNNK